MKNAFGYNWVSNLPKFSIDSDVFGLVGRGRCWQSWSWKWKLQLDIKKGHCTKINGLEREWWSEFGLGRCYTL